MGEWIKLIAAVAVIAVLVYGFRIVRKKISSPGLAGFLCMIMGCLALGAGFYALFTLFILLI